MLPPAPTATFEEVKVGLDGHVQRFPLERWLFTPDLAVGRWHVPDRSPQHGPPGAWSWGVWWRTRPYGAYRIHHPDGRLRTYRFDVLEAVRIGDGAVRYRDLLLDAWVSPAGDVRIEDADEVAEATAAGTLRPHQVRRIAWTRALFLERTDLLVGRVDAAIAAAVAHGHAR